MASQEQTGSSGPEEDVARGNQDEADLARVFTKGAKALSGCLPYCLVGILFIVILYILLLIFRHN
ncbi:MAG: hypothetical protein DMG05_09120 [Acidobacteria bacterium]|nr:MAG: hypothetical protein DMG05_09120 [Acidobacteriota bacterium]